MTGSAVQWLRDGLGIIDNASETEELALSVPNSAGVVFVPALTGLGAPDWDPNARGAIFGLTRGATKAHIVRATLEAIAYEVRDVVDVMVNEADVQLPRLTVDGGAAANNSSARCRRTRWVPRCAQRDPSRRRGLVLRSWPGLAPAFGRTRRNSRSHGAPTAP